LDGIDGADRGLGHGHASEPVGLERVVDKVRPRVGDHGVLGASAGRVARKVDGLVGDLVQDGADGLGAAAQLGDDELNVGRRVVGVARRAASVNVQERVFGVGQYVVGDAHLQPMQPDRRVALGRSEPLLRTRTRIGAYVRRLPPPCHTHTPYAHVRQPQQQPLQPLRSLPPSGIPTAPTNLRLHVDVVGRVSRALDHGARDIPAVVATIRVVDVVGQRRVRRGLRSRQRDHDRQRDRRSDHNQITAHLVSIASGRFEARAHKRTRVAIDEGHNNKAQQAEQREQQQARERRASDRMCEYRAISRLSWAAGPLRVPQSSQLREI